jgi:hypothetical protein
LQHRFYASLPGSLCSAVLYDAEGDYVYTLDAAVEVANERFDGDWEEVFNGFVGLEK